MKYSIYTFKGKVKDLWELVKNEVYCDHKYCKNECANCEDYCEEHLGKCNECEDNSQIYKDNLCHEHYYSKYDGFDICDSCKVEYPLAKLHEIACVPVEMYCDNCWNI